MQRVWKLDSAMKLVAENLMKAFVTALLVAFSVLPAAAQSTATPVQPGSVGNTGCYPGQTNCFIPYSNANPLPVIDNSGGATTANQGTAAAVSAGWPVTNGEPADATGTFTNATQSGNVSTVSIDGYGTALITINGTYGTATATFLASDDGGVTYKYPLGCTRTDGSTGWETGYTSLSNVSRAWLCPAQGFDSVQVLSSAVASGTVNVRISQSAAPTSAAVSQPLSGTVTVVGTGTFATQDTITPSATVGVSTQSCTVACASTIVSGAHSVYGISGSATVTGTILVYDATSCSANGTVTPKKAFAYTVANAPIGISWADVPMINATGIAVCFSSTGPFTATASTTAFLSVDFK